MIENICVSLLHYITKLEKVIPLYILKNIKIIIIKQLITNKQYVDNDITNILCTKLDKNNKCDKAINKLINKKTDIFRISPRGLVFCVIHKNYEMLKKVKEFGYPIEMIVYADNYHLIKKRRLENVIYLL